MSTTTPKQQKFLVEFFKDYNWRLAVIRAGYPEKNASQIAYRMKKKVHIQEEIQAHMRDNIEQSDIVRSELLLACAEVIRAKIPDYINEKGFLSFDKNSPNQGAVQSYKEHRFTDKQGCEHLYKTIKLVPKGAFIEQAAKLSGIDKSAIDHEIVVNINFAGGRQETISQDEQ